MRQLESVDAARAWILVDRRPPSSELIVLESALGRVLSAPIVAGESVPRFANSAMDGFAIRAEDCGDPPVQFRIIDEAIAGVPAVRTVGPFEAVRIMTGAPIPQGADAVCPLEATRYDGDCVEVSIVCPKGVNVRHPGEDIRAGQEIFGRETVLGPAHLGVLASLGIETVEVYARIVVGVLSSGNELVPHTEPALGPAAIRDSNRIALLGRLAELGVDGVDLGIVVDNTAEISRVLEHASRTCDMILTTGGVGPGDHDLLERSVIDHLHNARVRSFQLALRPGRPFFFAELGNRKVPLCGLPGNPVAAMVSFELLVVPLLSRQSRVRSSNRYLSAISDVDIKPLSEHKLTVLVACAYIGDEGRVHVLPNSGQRPHLLWSLAQSNALMLVNHAERVERGDEVEVILRHGAHIGSSML